MRPVTDFRAPLKIYCACAWRRPAVLGMLMYRLYIPLPALRRSPPATRSLRFLEVPFRRRMLLARGNRNGDARRMNGC